MGAYDNCIILIPALQSDERLTQMIHGLHERGFHKIAVMDDESSDDRQKYFQEVEIMGVKVIHHSKKMGKGVALRFFTNHCRFLNKDLYRQQYNDHN